MRQSALATDWPLVGRDDESSRLDDAAGSGVGDGVGGGAAVVAGGLGVGKSRLLADFLERASRQGARTILVRATRSTATIPFGPFAAWTPDAVSPAATDRLQILRTTTRALLESDRDDVDVDATIVAVDDAHLLDEGSAALVLHLAAHTPASVVVTVRTGEPSPDAVVALWKEGMADRLDLQPLSEPATAALSEQVLGGSVDPAARRHLWALSRGTPLYLREVLHAGVAQGVLAEAADGWLWRGNLRSGRRPGELGHLGSLLDDRLADLDADERRTLELVAIGEPLPLHVVAELGCMDGLTDLERRGLVVTDDPDGGQVARLGHPLYGEVLRVDLPRSVARLHHERLATAAVAVGWHGRDPLRVAAWWLEGGGTHGPPDLLGVAARRALALGAWDLADRLACAAESSGAGAEATLIRTAALVHMGGWGAAEGVLAGVRTDGLDDEVLAEHARLRAGFLSWSQGRLDAGRAVLVQAAGEMQAAARSRALAESAHLALMTCELEEATRLATHAMNDAGLATGARVRAMAVVAATHLLRGHTSTTLWLAEAASPFLADAMADDPYPDNPASALGAAHCFALVLDGRVGEAAAVAESALAPFLSDDVEARRTVGAVVAGRVALFGGQLTLARQRGQMALDAAGPGPGSQWPAAVLAMAAAQLGDTAAATEALHRAAASTPTVPLAGYDLGLARAWLHAAQGDASAAREMAAHTAASAAGDGAWFYEMLALVDLARLGAPEAAADRLAELGTMIEGPYATAAAACARACVTRDGDDLDHLSADFEAMGALLLAAEAAAGAAAAHHAAGRRPSHGTSLRRARLLAARCDGARTPALRGVDALPSLTTLTRREREVVGLAARGLTNRAIATRLYISIRTVNAHLSHTYTKLGMNDRADLAAWLLATTR